jgi:23S rRNA (uracil-5-)-methyltransferase RumA
MEFTFGDEKKDGPLSLGMHKKNSFYDIVTVDGCQIIDEDFRLILKETLDFFANRNIPYYHRMRHDGFLRHLLVRKGIKSGEILIDIVTTSALDNINSLMKDYSCYMEKINYKGHLKGILHTTNDNLADTVKNEGTEILFGEDFFYEEILGLKFKITPFSFFQTNSLGAEVLYNKARDYIGDTKGKVVFDLYSGTGTIAQIVAPVANEVIGVEIVPEAVEAAKENAKLNKLDNCRFIAGDVLKVIDEVNEKPDIVILDPPREGVHYKALEKITGYGTNHIVYISCKPTSLARDLEILEGRGYKLTKACSVDLFPWTTGIETVALLTKNL